MGDCAIKAAAADLRSSLRDSDVVIRFGGDEFVAVLQGIEGNQQAIAAANRVLDRLLAAREIKGITLTLPASIGVAVYPGAGRSPEALLEAADRAMYEAKSAGGSRYHLSN